MRWCLRQSHDGLLKLHGYDERGSLRASVWVDHIVFGAPPPSVSIFDGVLRRLLHGEEFVVYPDLMQDIPMYKERGL